MKKKCLFCGETFETTNKLKVYCSKKCAMRVVVNCANCNKEVVRNKIKENRPRFCSPLCKNEYYGTIKHTKCDNCGKSIRIPKSVYKRSKNHYCSETCQHEAYKDRIFCKCETCGKEFETIKYYEGTRKYCSHECRRCVLPEEQLRFLYTEKEMSMLEISEIFGVSESAVATNIHEYKIKARPSLYPNQDIIICEDGTKVKSRYEKVIYETLCDLGIDFEYEPRFPYNKRYASDFLVKDVYVEIWGIKNNKRYTERRIKKTKLYRKHNLKLLEIYPEDFKNIDYKIQELKRLIG